MIATTDDYDASGSSADWHDGTTGTRYITYYSDTGTGYVRIIGWIDSSNYQNNYYEEYKEVIEEILRKEPLPKLNEVLHEGVMHSQATAGNRLFNRRLMFPKSGKLGLAAYKKRR